jgi:6-pyruvoyltetrahydropterin/6-carboxytetrahydropterin synthase
MQTIKVKHNVEMAHRLYETPGKCQNIHGHSWWVELELGGEVDNHGLLETLDFGMIKKHFRKWLDTQYDHRVLLNARDPWSQVIGYVYDVDGNVEKLALPGRAVFNGDPTTENFATEIGSWAKGFFACPLTNVTVWETSVNCATWSSNA